MQRCKGQGGGFSFRWSAHVLHVLWKTINMCIKGPQTSPATGHTLASCCLGDGRRRASGGEVPGGGGGDVPRPSGGVVLFSVAQVS